MPKKRQNYFSFKEINQFENSQYKSFKAKAGKKELQGVRYFSAQS